MFKNVTVHLFCIHWSVIWNQPSKYNYQISYWFSHSPKVSCLYLKRGKYYEMYPNHIGIYPTEIPGPIKLMNRMKIWWRWGEIVSIIWWSNSVREEVRKIRAVHSFCWPWPRSATKYDQICWSVLPKIKERDFFRHPNDHWPRSYQSVTMVCTKSWSHRIKPSVLI